MPKIMKNGIEYGGGGGEDVLIADTGWHTPNTQQSQYDRYIYAYNYNGYSVSQLIEKYSNINFYFFRETSSVPQICGSCSINTNDITNNELRMFCTTMDYDNSIDQFNASLVSGSPALYLITKRTTPIPLRIVMRGIPR